VGRGDLPDFSFWFYAGILCEYSFVKMPSEKNSQRTRKNITYSHGEEYISLTAYLYMTTRLTLLEIVHIQEHNNGVMIASYSEITFLDESYRWMTIFLTLEMKIRSVQHKQEVSSRKRKVFIYCIFLTDIFIKAKNLLTK